MPEPAGAPPRANVPELSVSELSSAIKRALEEGFGFVRLRGEISGYRGPHASGHCYFALKDDKAKIEAVVWRGVFQRLRFKPQEGAEVIATGKVTSYPGSSKYQIVIEAMEPAGIGALMALLEERKKKLAAEGLFGEERKRKLPFLPAVVGIVTSPTGAVIRDMLAGFAERFPARVLVWPVRVQGETCAAEVAAAIRGFNALEPGGRIPRPEVLIVARGGGSLEDLWGFNEEAVVRAAAASAIPLVSAVGHETDWTLIDLAADARAPTPTKAAEWVVPKHSDLIAETQDFAGRLAVAMRRKLEAVRVELRAAARGLPRLEDLLALPRQRFDAAAARLAQAFAAQVHRRRTRLADELRLARALLANTRAHATRHVRVAARLQPRLLAVRIERCHQRLGQLGQSAREALGRTAGRRRQRLAAVAGGLRPQALAARIDRSGERLDALARRGTRAHCQHIAQARHRLGAVGQMLASLSYQSVLKRGFALIRDEAGEAVRSAAAVTAEQRLSIELADGRFGARVTEPLRAGTAAATSPVAAPGRPTRNPRPPRSGNGGQGSLF